MSFKGSSQPYFWGLLSIGFLFCAPVMAQDNPKDNTPIKQPSALEVMDQVSGLNRFWSEIGTTDDAKHVFLIDRDESRIERRSKYAEIVYQDLFQQQTENHPIVRTQDIPNLFGTSLLEMQK